MLSGKCFVQIMFPVGHVGRLYWLIYRLILGSIRWLSTGWNLVDTWLIYWLTVGWGSVDTSTDVCQSSVAWVAAEISTDSWPILHQHSMNTLSTFHTRPIFNQHSTNCWPVNWSAGCASVSKRHKSSSGDEEEWIRDIVCITNQCTISF